MEVSVLTTGPLQSGMIIQMIIVKIFTENQMDNYSERQGNETIKRLLGLLNRSMTNDSNKT